MKLRTKYILFVGVLHGVALVLSYFIFTENKVLFIVAEGAPRLVRLKTLVNSPRSWNLTDSQIPKVRKSEASTSR